VSAETPRGRQGSGGNQEGEDSARGQQSTPGQQGAQGRESRGPVRLGPPSGQSGLGQSGLDQLPFDQALAELQGVVSRLETGGLPLEESIALYERGVALHDHCARLLSDAELRVQRLVEQAGGSLRAIDLTPEDETP
jgi:exodeoxyribonuclease VII small subunit